MISRVGCLFLLLIATVRTASTQAPPFTLSCDTESADSDFDGITDRCELAFASAAAPILVVRAGGCNWDSAAMRTGGGYFFAVQPVDSVIRVAYLPAYFRDCGWRGVKCWLPYVDCAEHDGDSEFIAIDLKRSVGGAWKVSELFLSAHCFGRHGKACRWYGSGDLGRFNFEGPHPVIWVAEGRNANYPDKEECDRGLRSIDTCDHNEFRYQFPLHAEHNIGSRLRPETPGGCVYGRELNTGLVDANAMECFWVADRLFAGWQKHGPGVTPYTRYLHDIARF